MNAINNKEEVKLSKCFYCDDDKICRYRFGLVTICDDCENNDCICGEEPNKNCDQHCCIHCCEPICMFDGTVWICQKCVDKTDGETDDDEEFLETKCGCAIRIDSREHDECRCDDDGENWICADCYNGEYDEEEYHDIYECERCGADFDNEGWSPKMIYCEHCDDELRNNGL